MMDLLIFFLGVGVGAVGTWLFIYLLDKAYELGKRDKRYTCLKETVTKEGKDIGNQKKGSTKKREICPKMGM